MYLLGTFCFRVSCRYLWFVAGVYGIRPGAVALQEMSAGRQFPLPLFNFWPNDPRVSNSQISFMIILVQFEDITM